jgi:3-hydroxyacyl-CoA dehydrogenase
MENLVRLERDGSVAVIVIDNPPVNALSEPVAEGIDRALAQAVADTGIDAIVLMAAGRTFPAGADIRELELAAQGKAAGGPEMHDRFQRIEDSPKPVVMAVHGNCLGGGCELAMSGHYRVAAAGTNIGQPEVNLGLIPGAEGTQRLPRLVGVQAAIDLCVTGKPIKAAQALQMGLLDAVIEGGLREGAVAFARSKAGLSGHRQTRKANDQLGTPEANAPLFAAGKALAGKIRRNQHAPLAAVDAIQAATTMDFNGGCQEERRLFDTLLSGTQAQAMIHGFFAERAVAKLPGITKDTPVYDIKSAALIGAGTMGQGISMALANAGIPVLLKDVSQEALDRGLAGIAKNYAGSVAKGRFTQEVMDQRIALIKPQLSYAGFEQADLIIEAAYESMELKKKLYAEIDAVAKPDCVLATNTSTLNIDEIAAITKRPEMVVGLHFFSPAHVMRLVEIVRGAKTGLPVLATALAIAKRLGKVGVVVGNCRGFVGNRMMLPYMREAQLLVEEGTTPAAVDHALTGFGMAMGIFAVDDMGGIDLAWRVRQEYRHLEPVGVRQPVVLEKLYEMKRWGQKTGSGWFRYEGGREPKPDATVDALIRDTAQAAGIAQHSVTNEEILDRCILIMVNEAARILEEGHAERAADIDVIYLTGYGFPGYRGGPMKYADAVGLKKVYERICEFHRTVGPWWEPAPLLRKLAEAGSSFGAWDEAKRVN